MRDECIIALSPQLTKVSDIKIMTTVIIVAPLIASTVILVVRSFSRSARCERSKQIYRSADEGRTATISFTHDDTPTF